ncbi:hypothetical protein Droror1_Dr00001032 [Drosera rotundifolia]
MTQPGRPINVSAITRKIDVDNRIPLRRYYRTADTLLKQADIYRGEKNVIDLYIMLLRYSSLVSETIPLHRDYQILHSREKAYYRKKLFEVIDELESLKPEFQLRNQGYQSDGPVRNTNGSEVSSLRLNPSYSRRTPRLETIQSQPANRTLASSWKKDPDHNQLVSSNPMPLDMKFQTLSLNLPLPKQETLSRHSFLGPNGLRRQWQGPTTEIKVQYPSYTDLTPLEDPSLIQARESEAAVANDEKSGKDESLMQEVLSLNDGKWSQTADELCPPQGNLWQPTPPPVLAEVHPEVQAISPSRVADPRPGPARSSPDGIPGSNSFQDLYIPVRMLEDFLRLAQKNTSNNLETCGVLAGSLKNRTFHITTLIVPKQESTSDSCQTLNEEEIFEVQDKLSLFPLGWIHTHPSQTCFMSSVDLHTHYSYQIMLPEAIAIVMAPTDTKSPHGIFHLSDPGGLSVIRSCEQRGFHPHEEPSDGSPLYEHCSHVFMDPSLRFEVVDLR